MHGANAMHFILPKVPSGRGGKQEQQEKQTSIEPLKDLRCLATTLSRIELLSLPRASSGIAALLEHKDSLLHLSFQGQIFRLISLRS